MPDNRLFKRATFTFVGEVIASRELVTTKKLSETSKWFKTKLNLGIKCESNKQFLNIEYLHEPSISTCKIFFDDGTSQDVSLDNTLNPDIVAKVSDTNKIIVDLEQDFSKKAQYTSLYYKRRTYQYKEEKTEEDLAKIQEYTSMINTLADNRVEFIHMKDVIDFLSQNIGLIKNNKVKVVGNVKINYYNGKTNLQYVPTKLELVPQDTLSQLKIYTDFFFHKDSINDIKEESKMLFNGYIGSVVRRVDKLYPLALTLDYSKVDMDNPTELNVLNYLKSQFAIKNKEQIHKIGLELNIINGSTIIEFDESCLTDNQRMGIRLGLNTIDDFKPTGNIYGDNIQELRIAKPDLKKYPYGAIEVFDINELSNYKATDDSDKKHEDIKSPIHETKDVTESEEDLMSKLFGNI